jgi:hypothetical protein
MSTWQPIETAPRDGRLLLLYPSRCWSDDVNCDAEVGYWDECAEQFCSNGPTADDWPGYTHWAEMPEPPE